MTCPSLYTDTQNMSNRHDANNHGPAGACDHIFMPDMSDFSAGAFSPRMVAGGPAVHRPNAIRMMPNIGARRGPTRNTFSAKINAEIKAIQKRLMTPTANSTSIKPQQQPTQ